MTNEQRAARDLASLLARLMFRTDRAADMATAALTMCAASPLPVGTWAPIAAITAYEDACRINPQGAPDQRAARYLSALLATEGLAPSVDAAKRAIAARLPEKRPWPIEVVLDAYRLEDEVTRRKIEDGERLAYTHPASDPAQ